MTISTEVKDVLLAQSREQVLQQITDGLKSDTSALSGEVIRDLLHVAQRNSFVSDDTLVPRLAQHLFATERLHKKLNNALSQLDVHKKHLADIRAYLGVGSDQELAEAVAEGRKHTSVPQTERDKIIAEAEARRKAAQEAQQVAKK